MTATVHVVAHLLLLGGVQAVVEVGHGSNDFGALGLDGGGFVVDQGLGAGGVKFVAGHQCLHFSARVLGLADQGRTLLGGDASFALIQREATKNERAFLDSSGKVSVAAMMRAMARSSARAPSGEFALVDLKAVDDNYPMLGAVRLAPQIPMADLLAQRDVWIADMRRIDEFGVAVLMREVIERVRAQNGVLHVSLDVDFLDPVTAPGVGTTVPGGATYREAHLVMEILHDSGLVRSLDLVELNPFLDDRGLTARTVVELVGSLFGQQTTDRPTPTNAVV